MVEHDLAKVGVASSSLVSRSNTKRTKEFLSSFGAFFFGSEMAGPWPYRHGRPLAVFDGEVQCAFGLAGRHRCFGLKILGTQIDACDVAGKGHHIHELFEF